MGCGSGLEVGLQTTLLGLAIAIILALVTALAGPLLIDWSNYRSSFEAEASRLVGVNVRVAGAIDARLLPSPRLTLHDIAIGDGADTIRARALGVEFALGPLTRGEWRAAELRLAGPQLSLGLDGSGHMRAPSLAVAFKPGELSIDRLSIEDGTISFADAVSGASVTLERVSFTGDARSLAGPVKGEGAFTVDGKLYPYRVAAGRLGEDNALKLRLNVDPDRSVSIEADGTLKLADSKPRFEGLLSLSRPVGIGARGATKSAPSLTPPWRVSGTINATGQSALMQNVEFQYGSEAQAVRLTGVADFKFGQHPRVDGVLSGRQIDLDRALPGAGGARPLPAAVIRKLAELSTAASRPGLPIQIGIGIDQLTLGGNTVQGLRGDITSSADGWNLDRMEFRAPGLTQVGLSGHLAARAGGIAFSGRTEISVSEPKTLIAWLEGRGENVQSEVRPLSMRGDVTLADDQISVEDFRAELNRDTISGRIAYAFSSGNRPARLDVRLEAPAFDIDTALDFGRALLANSTLERPGEMTLAADVGRATIAGIQARDARARVRLDTQGLQIERLSVADFGGGSLTASGQIETGGQAPRGLLAVDLETKRSAAVAAVVERFAPNSAAPVANLLERVERTKLHATLDIAREENVSLAQFAVTGEFDQMRVDARMRARGDWTKPSAAEVRIEGTVDAPDGAPLIRLLGLDRIAATGKGPGRLKVQAAGPIDRDVTIDMQLSAPSLAAQVSGQGRFFDNQGVKIGAALEVSEVDLRPLRPAGGAAPLPLRLKTRATIAGGAMTFEDIDAKLDGSGIRGRLAVDNASPRRIDGTLEVDAADGPSLISYAIGLPPDVAGGGAAWRWSGEPFGAGAFGKFAGNVTLKLARITLLPGLMAREFNATLHLDKNEIALDDATAELAGGRLAGAVSFRSAENGLTARAKATLTGADAALVSAAARPPVRGTLSATTEMEGVGLSPVALVGSLKGSGKIVLADGQIAGLDPHVFDTVTRAVDQGLAIESGRISELASKTIDNGQLSIKRAESAVSVSAGQMRLGKVAIESKEAPLSIAGMLDLTDGSVDARLTLSGLSEAAGAHPALFVELKGPSTAPSRSIDVSALTGWLTLRAVEGQTNRLRAIESVPAQSRGRSVPKTRQAPVLPAPIDIKPAPAPRSAGQPAASVGSQN